LKPDYVSIDLLEGVTLKVPDTVKHYYIKCERYDKIKILNDVIVKYGGLTAPSIVFTETKQEANDVLLDADLKPSC